MLPPKNSDVMPRESGASSNPRAYDETRTVSQSESGGYWIARSSRAMTAGKLERLTRTKKEPR